LNIRRSLYSADKDRGRVAAAGPGIVLALVATIILTGQVAPALAGQLLEDVPGVRALHWYIGTLRLPSGGLLTASGDAKVVVGADAAALQQLLNGAGPPPEAYFRVKGYGTVQYFRCGCGYIQADDWQCINADDVLASLTRNYPDAQGEDVLGWAIPPHYDPSTETITYMLHARDDDVGEFYDGIAMVLGRYGVEIIEAGTRKMDYTTTLTMLRRGVAAFRFAPGYRYSDHAPSDTISPNHIAKAFLLNAFATDLAQSYTDCRISVAPQPRFTSQG